MNPALTPELRRLFLATLMTGLFWIPYILQRILDGPVVPHKGGRTWMRSGHSA